MKKILFFTILSLFVLQIQAQRNVVLIIADDLGTDYLGFYENHKDTAAMPNIRKLLKKGVRFSRAWSNPLCSPTRSGILTGRYSFRTGVGNAVGGATSAVLDTAEVTIPRLLNKFKPNGIAKANIGKWHLQLSTPKTNYFFPNKMGYDYFEGNFEGILPSYTNWTKVTNGTASTVTNYATTETVDNAIAWVKTEQNKPFFLWLAFNAPHSPFHLPPTNLHSYKNLSGTAADITANPKSYFKATVEALDTEIGRLFDNLQAINQLDNTDIIFIGDNGNEAAVAQNTGGAKGSIYQEGVSVPFIISGPSVVNPNRVSDALVNTQDLFATILELFGHTTWQSQIPSNKPVDSKSIMPILKNTATEIRPWAFTEVFKNPTVAGDGKAMRNNEYKLLDFDNGTQKFFNLKNDPTEDNDLLKKTLIGAELTNYNYLCSEMSKLVGTGGFCNITAAEDIDSQANSIKVNPNPASDLVTVQFGTVSQADFEVILSDLTGKMIQKTTIYQGSIIAHFDTKTLNSGEYIITIQNGNTMLSKKILIEK
jgi:arylsulfatase B